MSPEAMRRLATAGLTIEQIALVIEVTEADYEAARERAAAKREATRQRQIKHREAKRNALSHTVTVTPRDTASKPNEINGHVTLSVSEPPIPTLREVRGREKGRVGRATRLKVNWDVPREWIDEAIAEGLDETVAFMEAVKMRDWSMSSPKGAKLDWHAAWRGWFRRRIEEKPTRQLYAPSKTLTMSEALKLSKPKEAH